MSNTLHQQRNSFLHPQQLKECGGRRGRRRRKTEIFELLVALKECSRSRNLRAGLELHARAAGLCSNRYVVAALITMYARCGSIADARKVFNENSAHLDVVSWSALITGYVQNQESEVALELFDRLESHGSSVEPDARVFLAALSACSDLGRRSSSKRRCWLEKGRLIHKRALQRGECDVFVENGLIDMYSACDSPIEARSVFDAMIHPDVVSWTSVIQCHAENEEIQLAMSLFQQCPAPNSRTFIAALTACTKLLTIAASSRSLILENVKKIHSRAAGTPGCMTSFVENTLLDFYSKCGAMDEARDLFNRMKNPSIVSITALARGFTQKGESHSAVELLADAPRRDSTAFLAALAGCSRLTALQPGRVFHAGIIAEGLLDDENPDAPLGNALIDLYSKCGSMARAKQVFDSLPGNRITTISWNTLICGYGAQGDARSALELIGEMMNSDLQVEPNDVSFLCALSACSHSGLVEPGIRCFRSMLEKFPQVKPGLKHYNCVVDLLARAGRVEEAERMAREMEIGCGADAATWTSILAGCKKWNWVESGRAAYEKLVRLDPHDLAAQVLMASIEQRNTEQEQEEQAK